MLSVDVASYRIYLDRRSARCLPRALLVVLYVKSVATHPGQSDAAKDSRRKHADVLTIPSGPGWEALVMNVNQPMSFGAGMMKVWFALGRRDRPVNTNSLNNRIGDLRGHDVGTVYL